MGRRLTGDMHMMLFFILSCSVVEFQEGRLERSFLRADLAPADLVIDDRTVHYWAGGTGTPVLLLHGFGAHAIYQWADQVGPFAKEHQLIVPDLLYFGGSNATDRYAVTDQAEAFFRLLDHLNVEKVDVVGISYGGFVAWSMAASQPERIGKVVLVDSPGTVFTPEDEAKALATFGVSSLDEIVVPDAPDDLRRLLELAYYKPPAVPDFILEDVYNHLYQDRVAEKTALIKNLHENADHFRAIAPRISQPALLVWGEFDPLFPLEIQRRLSVWLGPGTQTAVLPKTRHAPNIEAPDAFNEIVLAFLKD